MFLQCQCSKIWEWEEIEMETNNLPFKLSHEQIIEFESDFESFIAMSSEENFQLSSYYRPTKLEMIKFSTEGSNEFYKSE